MLIVSELGQSYLKDLHQNFYGLYLPRPWTIKNDQILR